MSQLQKVEFKVRQIETMFNELDSIVRHIDSKIGSHYSRRISGEVIALKELGRSLVIELQKAGEIKQSKR